MVGNGVLSVATPEVVSLEGSFEELSEQDEMDRPVRINAAKRVKRKVIRDRVEGDATRITADG